MSDGDMVVRRRIHGLRLLLLMGWCPCTPLNSCPTKLKWREQREHDLVKKIKLFRITLATFVLRFDAML